MISSEKIRALVAALGPSDRPILADIGGGRVQLWSARFVFELQRTEVTDEAFDHYLGGRLDMSGQSASGDAGAPVDPFDWRAILFAPSCPVEEVTQVEIDIIEVESVEYEVAVLRTESGLIQCVLRPVHDFVQRQLLQGRYRIQRFAKERGGPVITVWEGDELVGAIGSSTPVDEEGNYVLPERPR